MRVTDNMMLSQALTSANNATDRMFKLQRQAQTGLSVIDPSDDPVAFAATIRGTGEQSQLQNRSDRVAAAQDDLNIADGSLSSANDILTKALQIATQMANGTNNAQDRSDAAAEIAGLSDSLMQSANAKGSSGYVFAGTANQKVPFVKTAAGTVSFAGNDDPTEVEIADGVTARSNASGAQAFTATGSQGQDIFGDLSALATALSTNNTAAIQTGMDSITKSIQQVSDARSEVGTSVNRFQSVGTVLSNVITTVTANNASLSNADAVSTYSNLTQAQTAYQESLSVTQKVLSVLSPNGVSTTG
jgi:flagellar hook-associated protein 3 FlgL